MDLVSFVGQVGKHFFGPSRMACAFAVHTLEDVCHEIEGRVYRARMIYGWPSGVGRVTVSTVAGSSRSLM
jgi:hypothetical protein